jgi:hypothetical protein
MSMKDKTMDIMAIYPKLVTLGIGLAITFVLGTAVGIVDHHYLIFAKIEDQQTLIIPRHR